MAVAILGWAAHPAMAAPTGSGGRPGKPVPVDPAPATRAGSPFAAQERTHTVPNPLLKEVFAEGEDEDQQGESPALSALCQDFIGKPNPYRPLAPNVDTIVGDTIVQVGSQTGCRAAQNETTIAVNPYNPNNLVAGSNDYRVFNDREQRNDGSGWAYTTFDGGRTWKNVQLPKLVYQTGAPAPLSYMDSAGDPAIAFGPFNTVYYANLVFSRAAPPEGQQQASGIAVSVSRDGGLTWGNPAIVQLDGVSAAGTPTPTFVFNDKEWIGVDPIRGTAYVTWTRFTYDDEGNYLESPITLSRSTDGGRHWSQPNRVSPTVDQLPGGITPFASGSNPVVQHDGTLQLAYETSVCVSAACDQAGDHDATVVATSRDGGRTFRHTEVAVNYDFPVNEELGTSTLTGENFRINSFPQLTVDRLTDRLWVTWADDRHGRYDSDGESVTTNGDALLSGSTNGRDWSPVRTLGTAADEVFPAVAAFADQVAVTYYTRAYDRHGIGLDYAFQSGRGQQVAAGPVRRITTQTADPRIQFVALNDEGEEVQGVFIGDYSAVALGSDLRLHPCWTDFRGRPGVTDPNQDVVSQSISLLR